MTFTTPRSIAERLRDTFPPVAMEETFADALRRIAASLDAVERASRSVARSAKRDGLTANGCLAMVEMIAMVAALDDVVVSAATSSRTEKAMEVRFILQGKSADVDELLDLVERSTIGRLLSE